MENSDPLAAFPRPPQRSCANFEDAIFRALAATEVWTLGPDDLESSLSTQDLPPILPLDYSAFCALTRTGGWALASTLDTRLAWEGLGFGVTGAQALLKAITTLTLSFIVFTFGSL